MSYQRVIPRDLFNEANLLKCYGKLWIELDRLNLPGVSLTQDEEGAAFDIWQNPDDGAITLLSVLLLVRGEEVPLWRPLNSREPWPLYALVGDTELAVFNDDGTLSSDMVDFLKGVSPYR